LGWASRVRDLFKQRKSPAIISLTKLMLWVELEEKAICQAETMKKNTSIIN
jgi:ATP-dependent Zn protease